MNDRIIKIKGKTFYCDCGCNVFHNSEDDKDIFICNGCETTYTSSEKEANVMKKYTIIFENGCTSGSHYHHRTGMHRVETDDIKKLMKNYNPGDVYFVLEGHPELLDDYKFDVITRKLKFYTEKT